MSQYDEIYAPATAGLPAIPYFPPGGPATPPPPCPLGGEYYYPRENWWMPPPQQSFALMEAWPRPPTAALGPQGYSLSPMAALAKWVKPEQIGIGGITAVAMGARGCPTPWSERTLYSRPKAADAEADIARRSAIDEELANEQGSAGSPSIKAAAPRWWPWG
jgi:hypothetical protein